MTRTPVRIARRTGFTLVEIIVVIAIIAVLISLLAAAVIKVINKADEVKARKDLSDLQLAIESFKLDRGVDYIPSRFRLREDLYGYIQNLNVDYLDTESWVYLKRAFPKLPTPSAPNQVVIDWNGNGVADQAVDLEGHQCLVFFLGGIPGYGPNTCQGFSTSPMNPAAQTQDRIGPFYNDFKTDRLVILPTSPVCPAGNPSPSVPNQWYFSYQDPWSKDPTDPNVYAYFSSYGKNNNYHKFYNYYNALAGNPILSDCPYLFVEDYANIGGAPVQGLWPYAQKVNLAVPQYLNSTSYQLFSAGPDKIFGQGTRLIIQGGVFTTNSYVWTPQNANILSPKGQDDLSNFYDRPLGSGN